MSLCEYFRGDWTYVSSAGFSQKLQKKETSNGIFHSCNWSILLTFRRIYPPPFDKTHFLRYDSYHDYIWSWGRWFLLLLMHIMVMMINYTCFTNSMLAMLLIMINLWRQCWWWWCERDLGDLNSPLSIFHPLVRRCRANNQPVTLTIIIIIFFFNKHKNTLGLFFSFIFCQNQMAFLRSWHVGLTRS